MTGRKPTPIALANHLHRSNDEKDDRLSREPSGCDAEFKPTKPLSKEAKREWDRLIKLYLQLDQKILNDLDAGLLTAYCEARARFIEAQQEYRKDPQLIVWTDKGPKENPLITLMDKQGQLIAKYGEQLALSPVGRARFGLAKSKLENEEEDGMAALLARGRA